MEREVGDFVSRASQAWPSFRSVEVSMRLSALDAPGSTLFT